MKYLCFRVDCDHSVGGGHLQRCLNIANSIKSNTKFVFFVETNKRNKKDINKILKNRKIIFFNKFNPKNEIKIFRELEKKNQDITYIFDVCNSKKIKKKKIFIKYIKDLSSLNKSYFIDGNKNESMIKYLKNDDFNGVISPYFVKKNFKKHYQGLKYFVFDPKNKNGKIKYNKIKKLLISFGNSDPKNITELVLKSLLQLKQRYHINVIIGPMFKKKLIEKIKFLSQNCKQHKFSIKKKYKKFIYFFDKFRFFICFMWVNKI